MKIKLTDNITIAGTSLSFHKGRTYTATPATNLPRWARLSDKGLTINKVFISRKGEESSALIEKENFEIVDCPEMEEITASYAKSKEPKPPREKKIVPDGLKLRDGYAPITEEQMNDSNNHYCGMGTKDGRCNRIAKYSWVSPSGIVQARCVTHATIPS